MDSKKIAVIGSGTMGSGIAHVFALQGYRVSLIDLADHILEKGVDKISKNLDRQLKKEKITAEEKEQALGNISTYTSFQDGLKEVSLVVEAVVENLDEKIKIFNVLDELTPKECILASNTSSISITKIASYTYRPEKVIGMHFMNPVPVMPLVEVIKGYKTDKATTDKIIKIAKELGKTPVEANDYPGFISNRILMPMINEAIYSLFQGVAGVSEIDTIMKLGMAHPMGPLQLADFIGLDVCLNIMNVLYNGFKDPKYAPCPLLVNMVESGHLGVKTGVGFYKYKEGTKETEVAKEFS